MAYIKNNETKVGKWFTTTKEHDSVLGKFTTGSKVKVTNVDQMRGYTIEDEFGNSVSEIGWII